MPASCLPKWILIIDAEMFAYADEFDIERNVQHVVFGAGPHPRRDAGDPAGVRAQASRNWHATLPRSVHDANGRDDR
jgi:hypothetical protein